MPGALVVGYDGTSSANAAAGEALRLASEIGAEVIFGFAYWTNPGGGEVSEMLTALRELGTGHLLGAALIGSTAHKLLHLSERPVLVVRAP